VGFSAVCHVASSLCYIYHFCSQPRGIQLVTLPNNLVDVAWGEDQPPLPSAPVRLHPEQWAGQSVGQKLAGMRAKMSAAGAGGLVVSTLDEVRGAQSACQHQGACPGSHGLLTGDLAS